MIVRLPRAADSADTDDLIAVVRRLSAVRSQQEMMSVVTLAVRTLLHADGAAFVLREGDRAFYAEEDAVSPLWKGRRFPLSTCVSGWCMLNREPAVVPDVRHDPRIPIDLYRPTFVKSLAMAPVGEGEPIAALGAYWSEAREIRPGELELLQTLAGAATLAAAFVHLQEAGNASAAPMATVAETRRWPAAPARPAAPSPTPVAYAARRLQTGLRPNSPAAYGAAVLFVAIAALVRLGVGLLELQSPLVFSTFYPAILLAILIGGAGPALLATGLSALAGLVLFLPHGASVTHGSSVVVSLSLFLGANLFTIWAVRGYQARINRLVAEDAHNLTLSREQNHRVQNALFIIETIVRGSLKDDPTRARTINQRIRGALSFVDIRYGASSRPIGVAALLTRQLEPFGLEQFDIDADASPLPASAQHLIALAAHELATNAVKHGALSTPDGRVSVGFAVGDRRATLSWRESGGPHVVEPNRRGYGSVLLRRLVEAAGGEIVLHFRPDGLAAELTLPFRAPRR